MHKSARCYSDLLRSEQRKAGRESIMLRTAIPKSDPTEAQNIKQSSFDFGELMKSLLLTSR